MTAVEAPNDRDRISPAADGARSRPGGEHGQDGPWKESIRADPARPRRLPRPAAGSRHGGPAQPARSRPIGVRLRIWDGSRIEVAAARGPDSGGRVAYRRSDQRPPTEFGPGAKLTTERWHPSCRTLCGARRPWKRAHRVSLRVPDLEHDRQRHRRAGHLCAGGARTRARGVLMTDGPGIIEQESPHAAGTPPTWYTRKPADTVAALDSDLERGLSRAEAAARLSRYGPNPIAEEKPPSVWAIALNLLREPMNIMLVAVVVVSILIGEISTALIVGLLIALNVVLGSRQELTARASVDALSKMQVPEARVVRDRETVLVPAVDLVPGDVVHLEAGDLVPADGRIVRSATLETQEAALTGESAPVAKDAGVLPAGDVALGDQTNMAFQNTSVTRGTATIVITETGMNTQMGRIATMLTGVTRTRSPLQRELDSLTKVLGIVAWTAVAFIVVVGALRGLPFDQLLLL